MSFRSPLPALALIALAVGPLPAAELPAAERAIVRAVDEGMPWALDLLQRTVDVPSATEDLEGVRRVGALYAEALAPLGFTSRWEEMPPEMRKAGHLIAERPGNRGARILLIGHLDTVLEGEPYRRDGDRAYGTGISDMKGATSYSSRRCARSTPPGRSKAGR